MLASTEVGMSAPVEATAPVPLRSLSNKVYQNITKSMKPTQGTEMTEAVFKKESQWNPS